MLTLKSSKDEVSVTDFIHYKQDVYIVDPLFIILQDLPKLFLYGGLKVPRWLHSQTAETTLTFSPLSCTICTVKLSLGAPPTDPDNNIMTKLRDFKSVSKSQYLCYAGVILFSACNLSSFFSM